MPSYNKNLNIHQAQYSSSLPKTNIQTNQNNNIQNNISNPPILYQPAVTNYQNISTFNQTNNMQPFGSNTRPYQLNTYPKNNYNYFNGLASYTPGPINGTLNNYISTYNNTHQIKKNTTIPMNPINSTIPG